LLSDVHSLNTGTVHKFWMKNLVTIPTVYSLDFGMFGKNAQTSDQKHCELIRVLEFFEIHSLEIRIYFYELHKFTA
jgi:hypothetical protein